MRLKIMTIGANQLHDFAIQSVQLESYEEPNIFLSALQADCTVGAVVKNLRLCKIIELKATPFQVAQSRPTELHRMSGFEARLSQFQELFMRDSIGQNVMMRIVSKAYEVWVELWRYVQAQACACSNWSDKLGIDFWSWWCLEVQCQKQPSRSLKSINAELLSSSNKETSWGGDTDLRSWPALLRVGVMNDICRYFCLIEEGQSYICPWSHCFWNSWC